MFPTLQIGGFALPLRPVLWLAGFWLCLTLTERRLPRFGLDGELAWTVGGMAGGVGLAAARVWYALSHWSSYQYDLGALAAPTIATLSLPEGAAVGLIISLAYLRRRRVPLAPFADAATPGLLAAFGLASIGALFGGDAYGAPTTVPWAIRLWDEQRHPSQIYEALVALAAWIIVGRLPSPRAGFTFLTATAVYAMGRVFVEAFRGDSLLIGDGVRAMQAVWLGTALLAVGLMDRGK
ncbi:MAG: prolipoprotein diacylglyceryl transferase [Chloroflexi bacterium]|nr:prolipoprotein diacylglyceryl transferase [Chloroflexota bacterium]